MKVFLINLDRCADRLEHMRAQLNGVAFERIPAIDGSNDPPNAKGLTRFELACLESHKIAWRKFLSGGENHACFLEDDLHIRPGFAALVGGEAWVPEDAHSVKLDTYLQKVALGERRGAIGGREVARLYSRHQSSAACRSGKTGAVAAAEALARNGTGRVGEPRAISGRESFIHKDSAAPFRSFVRSVTPSCSHAET